VIGRQQVERRDVLPPFYFSLTRDTGQKEQAIEQCTAALDAYQSLENQPMVERLQRLMEELASPA
jgi:hypothetical protein